MKRYKKNNLKGRLYKNKDFSEESIKKAYYNLDQKIANYLDQKSILDEKFPIINAFE